MAGLDIPAPKESFNPAKHLDGRISSSKRHYAYWRTHWKKDDDNEAPGSPRQPRSRTKSHEAFTNTSNTGRMFFFTRTGQCHR
ncbi:unnamed protein product, partial [Iphiclides podalirius]